MEASHLQIYWHDSQPVYTLTFQRNGSNDKLFTAGGDNKVRIWKLNREQEAAGGVRKIESMDFLGSLTHHEQAINVIRFNSHGDVLASAGDDGQVLLWKQEDPDAQQEAVARPFGADPEPGEADENKEKWVVWKRLRGGSGATAAAEIYDLAWSPDNRYIVVACMDNSIRLFDVGAGALVCGQADHGHYVQGVAWDPLNQFIVSQSADRSLHVYEIVQSAAGMVTGLKLKSKIVKAELPVPGSDVARTNYLFHNETLPSFFRRCSISPCGGLVVVPSGVHKVGEDETANCVYVYTRSGVMNGGGGVKNRPALRIPFLKKPALMVAFSPVFYATRQQSVLQLPYKLVFAVATTNEVLVFDTDAWEPLCVVGNIHYSPITDLAWSGDGSTLLVSSTDGFCSYVSIDAETQFGASIKPPALRAAQHDATVVAAAKNPPTARGVVNMLPVRKTNNDNKKRRIQPTPVDP